MRVKDGETELGPVGRSQAVYQWPAREGVCKVELFENVTDVSVRSMLILSCCELLFPLGRRNFLLCGLEEMEKGSKCL